VELTTKINEMVDVLDESEKMIIFEILKRFVSDNIATSEDLRDIAIAEQEFATGMTGSWENIL